MIRLTVRYTVAGVLGLIGGYFVLRAIADMAIEIRDAESAPPADGATLLLPLLFLGLAALVAFLPEFIPGQGRAALVEEWRCRQLGEAIARLPRGEVVRIDAHDPYVVGEEPARHFLRPADEDSRVVLCELTERSDGGRSLHRFLDLRAKRRTTPARFPDVILITATKARTIGEAWSKADPSDIDLGLKQVNINQLIMPISASHARGLARDINRTLDSVSVH